MREWVRVACGFLVHIIVTRVAAFKPGVSSRELWGCALGLAHTS